MNWEDYLFPDTILNKIVSRFYLKYIMSKVNIKYLYDNGYLTSIDVHFARFITRLSQRDDPDILLAGALVSNATGNGDVYLDLAALAGKPMMLESNGKSSTTCPNLFDWLQKLRQNPVIGKPGEFRPLILDTKNRLYLYRYWEYENKLSEEILSRIDEDIKGIDVSILKDSLKRLFPQDTDNDSIWQQVAAVTAAYKRFCVISGGPGTGKTFTVAKILALLLEQEKENNLKILLAAPTGKAAARIGESIKVAKKTLNSRKDVIDAIPSEAYTIHRMLITKPGSPYFFHDAKNPLKADVVVVDEASMIDLALMSKLLAAVPKDSRLIIIGDKDQLASVEAGAVLGDICHRDHENQFSKHLLLKFEQLIGKRIHAAESESKDRQSLKDCMTILKKNYRFGDDSEIGKLSRAVNNDNVDKALSVLKNSSDQIAWEKIPQPQDLSQVLEKKIISGYSDYLKTEDPATALECFNRFRILCVVKRGPFGINAINTFAENVLRREKLIPPEGSLANQWYRGRPILITRNDYRTGLFNGDMGITLPFPGSAKKDMYVFFPGKSGELRRFPPHRLPEHESVYAMTVHKSQGSEFDHVLFLLPDRDYPVLTRELFYTGITRAIRTVSIWGTDEIIKTTLSRKIERTSGLRDTLWR